MDIFTKLYLEKDKLIENIIIIINIKGADIFYT